MAFAFNPRDPDPKDGILCGPTSDVWLEPWAAWLRANGVRFHLEHTATDFPTTDGKLDGVVMTHGGVSTTVTGDATILAVPIEVTLRLLRAGKLRGSQLEALLRVPISDRWQQERPGDVESQLRRTWTADMVGVQYFLNEDLRVVHGHLAFPDAAWCLTAVAQQQFWEGGLARFGVPGLEGVFSVILSEWDTPSRRTGKTAREHLSAGDLDGLGRETWAQMNDGLGAAAGLDWSTVIRFRIDAHLVQGLDPRDDTFNPTPLLIHPIGAYALRPTGRTGTGGLYVGADYNRTNVDLASMEGANEGARQAVGALAADLGIREGLRPPLYPLGEGPLFGAVQAVDAVFFRFGLPQVLDADVQGVLGVLDRIGAAHPFSVLGRAAHDLAGGLLRGVGLWDELHAAFDADDDGDIDLRDLRLLLRGLLLSREAGRLRGTGASPAQIGRALQG